MGRSGYSDDADFSDLEDYWAWIRWCGAVKSSIKGKRGQQFLKDLIVALDAMPEKKLIAGELEMEGQVCALGAVGKMRGLPMENIDTYDWGQLSATFGIAAALAREVMYQNDEMGVTPEARWRFMRHWAVENLNEGEGVSR